MRRRAADSLAYPGPASTPGPCGDRAVFLEQTVLVGRGVMLGVSQACGSGSALSLTSGTTLPFSTRPAHSNVTWMGPHSSPPASTPSGLAVRDVVL